MDNFGGEFGQITRKLAKDQRKENLDKLLNQEMRQGIDLSNAHMLTNEQKDFYNVDRALEEEYQIKDILDHANAMRLTDSQRTHLELQFNRDENFRLINRGKKITGDSSFMTGVKEAIENYEAALHRGLYRAVNVTGLSESGARDYVESQTKTQLLDAIRCCNTVIEKCNNYLDRGPSIWFWRRNRYTAVQNALHRAQSELAKLEELQKQQDIGEYAEDLMEEDSLLTWMNKPALEEKRRKREGAKNSNYNELLVNVFAPKMKEYDDQFNAKKAVLKGMNVSRTFMKAACELSCLRDMEDGEMKNCAELLQEKMTKNMPEEKKKAKLQYMESLFEEILKVDLKEFNFNDYKDLFGSKFVRHFHILKLAFDSEDIFVQYRSLLKGDDKGLLALNKEQFDEVEAKREALMSVLPYMDKAYIVAKDPRYKQKNIYRELDLPYKEILVRAIDDNEKNTDSDYYKALAAMKGASLTADEKKVLFGPGMDIDVLYQDFRKRRNLPEGQGGDKAALDAIQQKRKAPEEEVKTETKTEENTEVNTQVNEEVNKKIDLKEKYKDQLAAMEAEQEEERKKRQAFIDGLNKQSDEQREQDRINRLKEEDKPTITEERSQQIENEMKKDLQLKVDLLMAENESDRKNIEKEHLEKEAREKAEKEEKERKEKLNADAARRGERMLDALDLGRAGGNEATDEIDKKMESRKKRFEEEEAEKERIAKEAREKAEKEAKEKAEKEEKERVRKLNADAARRGERMMDALDLGRAGGNEATDEIDKKMESRKKRIKAEEAEKERRAREAKEAKKKAEKEAREKARREEKERIEKEAREKVQKEEQERIEREAKEKAKEKTTKTKKTEKEAAEKERLEKEIETLAKDIGAIKVEKHYAVGPKEKIQTRMARFGAKFEKKKEKTKADLNELKTKAAQKAAFDAGAKKEEARINKLLKNAKADKIPGISNETKMHLAALMGDKASVNQELLKKYAEGGQARYSAVLSLIKNFMNIDTSNVDLSSTEAMIKQMDRLEKMTDATYSMLILLELNEDLLHERKEVTDSIKKKLGDIQYMISFYNNRKNLVRNKMYAENLDSEIGHKYDPKATPEEMQLLRLLEMDLYSPVYAGCFKKNDSMPEKFPEDSQEVKDRYDELEADMELAALHEFGKNIPHGFDKTKHFEFLNSVTETSEEYGEVYKGFVKEDVYIEGDSTESIVRHISNFANLKPTEYMSHDEVESLLCRLTYRENEGMTEEEKKRIKEIRFQAFREMRDIMLAHVEYLMEKYGNGYGYLSPEEMRDHGMEIVRDFHCKTNIGEFLSFCMRHKELYTDKEERIAKAMQFNTYVGSINGYLVMIEKEMGKPERDKINTSRAMNNASEILVVNNMSGDLCLTVPSSRDALMYTQKPDKVKWDYEYKDKLQHRTWDKKELEKLKEEAISTHKAVEEYKSKKQRQKNISKLKPGFADAVQMAREYKKDESQPKLSENEAANLFLLRRFMDEESTRTILELYNNRNKDKESMDEAVNTTISMVSENIHRIVVPVLEAQKKAKEKGKTPTYYNKEKDAANAVFRLEGVVKALYPDAAFGKEDSELIEEMKKISHAPSVEDRQLVDYIKLAYTTDIIENDLREIAEDKERERIAKEKAALSSKK